MTNMTKYTETKEYQEALQQYKTNLETYQPDVEWHFGAFEKGINFFGQEITTEEMQRLAKKVSPIGPSLKTHEVQDVSPSWEEYKEKFNGDWNIYRDWVENQPDIFFYARCKEEFNLATAYQIAASLGYRKIITEDLS